MTHSMCPILSALVIMCYKVSSELRNILPSLHRFPWNICSHLSVWCICLLGYLLFFQFSPLLPHLWFWPLMPPTYQKFGRSLCLLHPYLGMILLHCHFLNMCLPLAPNILVWEFLWSQLSYWNCLRMPLPFGHPLIQPPLLLEPVLIYNISVSTSSISAASYGLVISYSSTEPWIISV